MESSGTDDRCPGIPQSQGKIKPNPRLNSTQLKPSPQLSECFPGIQVDSIIRYAYKPSGNLGENSEDLRGMPPEV
eukprot:642292-Amorphochlora_amoeboformis.AAC.1